MQVSKKYKLTVNNELKLMNHDINNMGNPHFCTEQNLEKILRKDKYWQSYWKKNLEKFFDTYAHCK